MSTSLHSFDVFDTCLTRIWAEPADLWLELGRELAADGLIAVSPENFHARRREAENRARAATPGGECTLDAIARELAGLLQLPAEQVPRLVARELELERRDLRPVPEILARVRTLHAAGAQVLYISDTYFPREFVAGILAGHGFPVSAEGVFVSCEFGCSKVAGALFRRVRDSFGTAPGTWTHTGDNPDADVAGARHAGLTVVEFAAARLTPREIRLAEADPAQRRVTSRIAGAARLARLRTAPEAPPLTVIRATAAAVAGPLLCAFVLWCLDRAAARGLQRLYFVSRDGEILLRLARVLAPWSGHELELRYLHGSRQAWHLPAVHAISEVEREWILETAAHMSVASVLQRVGLHPDEVTAALHQHGFPDPEKELSPAEKLRLRAWLDEPAVQTAILRAAARQRETAQAYLEAQGLVESIPAGIVDVGWSGRALASLRRIAADQRAESLQGLYFALLKGSGAAAATQDEAFFFNRDQPAAHAWVRDCPHAVEVLFAGTHGRVVGYRRDGTGVVPDLAAPENAAALAWGLVQQQETIVAFAREMTATLTVAGWRDVASAITGTSADFFVQPAADEAAAFGAFPCEEDQSGQRVRPLAPPIRAIELRRYFPGLRRHRDELWPQASLAQSGAWVRFWAGTRRDRDVAAVRHPLPWWLARILRGCRAALGRPTERVIVFGASVGGQRTLRTLPLAREAIYVVDNNPARQGTTCLGLPVRSPDALREGGFDRVLIGSTYALEIHAQLLRLGLRPEQLEIVSPEILRG